jgi:GxxExxY protein
MEVHRRLAPGLLESTYEECLTYELRQRKLRIERQRGLPVVYKEVKLECGYRLDLFVEGRVVVELKSVDALAPIHEAIILTYLRLSGRHIGLLINFNDPVLKEGVRRFIV